MSSQAWTPDVVLLDELRASAVECPLCGTRAVVPLTKKQRAQQPDETTHACHPILGGCNQGFELYGFDKVTR